MYVWFLSERTILIITWFFRKVKYISVSAQGGDINTHRKDFELWLLQMK